LSHEQETLEHSRARRCDRRRRDQENDRPFLRAGGEEFARKETKAVVAQASCLWGRQASCLSIRDLKKRARRPFDPQARCLCHQCSRGPRSTIAATAAAPGLRRRPDAMLPLRRVEKRRVDRLTRLGDYPRCRAARTSFPEVK